MTMPPATISALRRIGDAIFSTSELVAMGISANHRAASALIGKWRNTGRAEFSHFGERPNTRGKFPSYYKLTDEVKQKVAKQ